MVAVMWKCKISLNFQKKLSSLGLYMVPERSKSSAHCCPGGICRDIPFCWRGFNSQCLRTVIFLHLFFTCLPEEIGSPCTNKAFWKKINAHRLSIASHCVLGGCAALICNHLPPCLYMVPEDTGGRTKQWSSGLHHVVLILWCGFECRTIFFGHLLSLVLLRKLVCHAQTKLARRGGIHTGFPFASHCVLGGCAALICNQSCPAEKFDHQGTMNPRGPQTRLFVGNKNTSWCQSEQPI